MNKFKKSKGITLIALIILIIILLILAVVSISAVTGDGIIAKAKESKKEYSLAQLEESIKIVLYNRKLCNATGSCTTTLKEDLETIKNVDRVEEVKDLYYVISGENIITVYEDEDIVIGQVEVWDGTSYETPEFKEYNWYIYNSEQFKFFADFVNNGSTLTEEQETLITEKGYNSEDIKIDEDTIVYLMADLDLGARQTNGELTQGTEWTPIGTSTDLMFKGTFKGNNHTIKGVYVNTTSNYNGIFGVSNTIEDLTVKDSYIKGQSRCGGIAGGVAGSITNCHNKNTTVIASKDDSDNSVCGGIIGLARRRNDCF